MSSTVFNTALSALIEQAKTKDTKEFEHLATQFVKTWSPFAYDGFYFDDYDRQNNANLLGAVARYIEQAEEFPKTALSKATREQLFPMSAEIGCSYSYYKLAKILTESGKKISHKTIEQVTHYAREALSIDHTNFIRFSEMYVDLQKQFTDQDQDPELKTQFKKMNTASGLALIEAALESFGKLLTETFENSPELQEQQAMLDRQEAAYAESHGLS